MDSLPQNSIVDYKPDTLDYLRKQYGFETLNRINDAINSLEDWIAKQDHFEMKTFDKGYLERLLIYNKGSVEKCKKKLDKLCTLRTLIPEFFAIETLDKNLIFKSYSDGLLRQMTPEYDRVHFTKISNNKLETEAFINYCKYFVLLYKYIQMKDYCNHVTVVADYTDVNMLDYIKGFDVGVARKTCEISFEGFSMRINAIHLITESKAVDAFLSLIRPLLGEKLGGRIKIHKSIDTVYNVIPKDSFPQDYGGKDKPLKELREDLFEELNSPKFNEYRREMNKACTNEALRQKDKFNEEYLGISGTFRTLNVD